MKKMMKRLSERSGESLIETIVSVLIAALAVLMLANAIGSSQRIISSNESAVTKYYESNNKLASAGESAEPGKIRVFKDGLQVKLDPEWGDNGETINCYMNEGLREPVISYGLAAD